MKFKIIYVFIPIFLIVITVGGFIISKIDNESYQEQDIPTKEIKTSGSLNLLEIDPIQFLNSLKLNSGSHCAKDQICSVTISHPPKGMNDDWITEDDVGYLLKLVDSKEPARPVCSIFSSYIPFGRLSTIGNEAMFLIEGFRKKSYPPAICSIDYFEGDQDEYKNWFEKYIQK